MRSVIFTWPSLTVPLQTELAMSTHVAVSDIRNDVSNIHHNVSKIREEISGQVRPVSAGRTQSLDNGRILTVA